MNSILHTVNKSPFSQTTLAECLERRNENDAILLLEDGVYAALSTQPYAEKIKQVKHCYALEHDIKARGLSGQTLLSNIQLINDEKFLQLSIEHSLTQSWY